MGSQFGYEKAIKALNIIESFTEEQRCVIKELVENIKGVQESISRSNNFLGIDALCRECRGMCCVRDIEDFLDVSDYIYIFMSINEDVRGKILQALKKESIEEPNCCALIGENGCILPDNARPHMCKAYHCEKMSDLRTREPLLKEGLDEGFEDLKSSLKRMGCDIGFEDSTTRINEVSCNM